MTNRERFLRTMHYESVDRPPIWTDGPWPDTFERWYAEGYPKGVELEAFLGVDAHHYHGAAIDTFLIPPIEPTVLEDHGDYIIRRDCFGATIKDFKDHTTMPQWLDYLVKTPRDLEALTERLEWNGGRGRVPADWDAQVHKIKASGLGAVAAGGSYYGILRNLMGMERLSLMYYDAPEVIKRYSDTYFNIIMRTLERAFADLPGEIIYVGFNEDFAYRNAPLLSPAMFREFIMPYYQEVTAFARSRGVDLFWLDSDGNIRALLPDLLAAGINIFYPMECAAGMDPLAIRRDFGRAVRMIGGIDKRALAAGKDAIVKEVRTKVPPLIAEGGYIPRVDHSVGTDISLENYLFYFKQLRECLCC
jgi:hypothetical protein